MTLAASPGGGTTAPNVEAHAFITGPNGVDPRDLGTLGGEYSYGFGINMAGQVVGQSSYPGEVINRAFITGPDGIGMRDLGTLGGRSSIANGINNAGQVTGGALTADGPLHAFITGPNGEGMTDLGTLGGFLGSEGLAINNLGQVVGILQHESQQHAFMTGPNGVGMTDLNELIDLPGDAYFDRAVGINDRGQIIADASNGRAYLLTPFTVPEPDANALLLTSLGLMGFIARRTKRGRHPPAIAT